MLLTLGLDSMFGTLEGALTSINDMMMFPGLRKELVCGIYNWLHALLATIYAAERLISLELLNNKTLVLMQINKTIDYKIRYSFIVCITTLNS